MVGGLLPQDTPPLLCDPPHEQRHHQNHPWESTWLRKQICERTITAFYYYFEVNLIIEKNDYTKKKTKQKPTQDLSKLKSLYHDCETTTIKNPLHLHEISSHLIAIYN